jgi:hypothetical protein
MRCLEAEAYSPWVGVGELGRRGFCANGPHEKSGVSRDVSGSQVLTALEVSKGEAEQAGVGGVAGDQQGGGFGQAKHVAQAAEQKAKGGSNSHFKESAAIGRDFQF